ncbi:MAG TPA: glycosyltransferase family 4 protein [Candidatus Sulfopaludibacter sp.]|nr:glycosyltransferase family 4 protein [Candidatus Sulfopaludibacter sp.]
MKLLILDQFSDLGGAQRAVLDLLPAVRRAGWTALFGLPGEGEFSSRVREMGFEAEVIDCGPYASGRKTLGDVVRFVAGTPLLARQIRHLADRARAELIYINGPRLLPAAALWRPKTPVLFHAHSVLPPGRVRQLAGASLRRLDAHVVAVCEYVADSWREYVAADRISVVYNGVAGPDRAVWNPHPGAPVVGCVGRIAPEKGQLEFVAAAPRILESIPKARFVIHGAALFGEAAALRYEADVRKAAANLPVQFAGWSSDVYGAFAEMDLLLVPSTGQEATTRVILEAQAAGVPVIALRSGGIPEVVTEEELADSTEEMGRLAVQALMRPDTGASQRARESWTRRFTLERYQAEMMRAMGG